MSYDLLIKGGRIYDGSGLPSFIGDVGVKGGRIAEIGRIQESAKQTIDAQGLAVSPGFIDHHTHMDAQVFWDPYATSEPQHGVTSIVMGNCGLTLAPVKDAASAYDALVKSFVRVEAIPRSVLEQGVPWGWHTFGDYLDALEGKVGINVGGLVGHIAVRQYAMGEESVEREATVKEIEQMEGLVREAMEGGALGFSTNRNERHMREDGKPVASRLASDEELSALCGVLGNLNSGVIETIFGRGLLRTGQAADIVIFDPDKVKAHEPEWAQDYPGATKRLIQRSDGIHHTIVNGRPVYENGCLTGELPGEVLRGSAYRGRQAAAA